MDWDIAFSTWLLSVSVAYAIFHLFYNVYLHPLCSYPGPWLARATVFYDTYYLIRGCNAFHHAILHEKYGEVVRVAPNTLSYISEDAWPIIYGTFGTLVHPRSYIRGKT